MEKSIKSILIPVNFSDTSENAILTGIAMSKRHGALLNLLYVRDNSELLYGAGKNAEVHELVVEADVAMQTNLEAKANKIRYQYGIECHAHSSSGPYHRSVCKVAIELRCDVIVIEKGNSGNNNWVFPQKHSVYKLLKYAKCPVLTVPNIDRFLNFRNILFPIRPIKAGLEKLDAAMPIIRRNNSSVLLFAPIRKTMTEPELDTVHKLLYKADFYLKTENVEVQREDHFTNDMAQSVVDKAVQMKSDLIIITATLRRGLMGAFTRNYTENVILRSPVPVLSVKLR